MVTVLRTHQRPR